MERNVTHFYNYTRIRKHFLICPEFKSTLSSINKAKANQTERARISWGVGFYKQIAIENLTPESWLPTCRIGYLLSFILLQYYHIYFYNCFSLQLRGFGGNDIITGVRGVFSQYPGNLSPDDMLHCILKGDSLYTSCNSCTLIGFHLIDW